MQDFVIFESPNPCTAPTKTVVRLNACKIAVQMFMETDILEFTAALKWVVASRNLIYQPESEIHG